MSCSSLHELLMNYSQRVMHQLAQSAVCNRFHTSVQRLARWLLLTAERAETTRFELTHELLAQMVGAPRSAVSLAASTLRDKGIIDYRRGVLTIRNTARLHKVACECFDVVSLAGPLAPAAAAGTARQSPPQALTSDQLIARQPLRRPPCWQRDPTADLDATSRSLLRLTLSAVAHDAPDGMSR